MEPIAEQQIAGKNFHPTLTHVVVGGTEQHLSITNEPAIDVISRELIRVRVGKLNESLSDPGHFEVRVATPVGMSNPLVIDKRIAIKSSYPYVQTDGYATFTLERQRTDANKIITTESLGTTPSKIPFRGLRLDIADFTNAIRPLIEVRNDFQAGDIIVAKGSLEFINPSQPRVDMTTTVKIRVDINRCATVRLPQGRANEPTKSNFLDCLHCLFFREHFR